MAEALLQGRQPRRLYPVTVAALGMIENAFFEKLRMLNNIPELWHIIPPVAWTAEFRCLAFRLISRQGCSVEELVAKPHRMPPFTDFLALDMPDQIPYVESVPECLDTPWSTTFRRAHQGNRDSAACQGELRMHAAVAKIEISKRESLHASLRRIILARSLHTHQQEFSDTGAD